MTKVRSATVWESLRNVLPKPWIEDEIAQLHQREIEDTLGKVIEDLARITVVAEDDGEIVGFAMGRNDVVKSRRN